MEKISEKNEEKIERKIGFIPAVHEKEEAQAIVKETMRLFQEDFINEVCVVSEFCICQMLKKAGIPPEKIKILSMGVDPVCSLFVDHLLKFRNEFMTVRIIAAHYCISRFTAQLNRKERYYRDVMSGLLTGGCPVYLERKNCKYYLNLFSESFRILKDLAVPN